MNVKVAEPNAAMQMTFTKFNRHNKGYGLKIDLCDDREIRQNQDGTEQTRSI